MRFSNIAKLLPKLFISIYDYTYGPYKAILVTAMQLDHTN